MPKYDPAFNPPAPVIPVEVRNPLTGASVQLRAQLTRALRSPSCLCRPLLT